MELIDRYSWTPQQAQSLIWQVYVVHPEAKADFDRSWDRTGGHTTVILRLGELEEDEREAYRTLYSQAEQSIDEDTYVSITLYQPAIPDDASDVESRPAYLLIPGKAPKRISSERRRFLLND